MQKVLFPILIIIFLSIPLISADAIKTESSDLELTKRVYQMVNDYRAAHGLRRLKAKKALNEIALEHSHDMSLGRVEFSHKGFEARAQSIKQYARVAYTVSENLFYYQGTGNEDIAKEALQGWKNSPGHKENMEGDFLFTGVGVAKSRKGEYYVTQIFVGKKK